MPFAAFAIVRFARALVAVATLVVRPRLVRQLPWTHIVHRVRTDPRTRFAAVCLGLSTISLVVGILDSPGIPVAFLIALVGVVVPSVSRERARAP